MIRDLLMRWAHAAELANLRAWNRTLREQLDAERSNAQAANLGYDNLVDHYNDMRQERDRLRTRLRRLGYDAPNDHRGGART